MSAKLILVTSLNGGCGKSTVCANLAHTLVKAGKRVLFLSLDRYCVSADLMLGCESSVLFDTSDFPEIPLNDICVRAMDEKNFSFAVCLPFSDKTDVDAGKNSFKLITHALACGKYDFVLVDKSALRFEEIKPIALKSDRVLIVSTQNSASLRSASLLGEMLFDSGVEEERMSLVLNSFYTDAESVKYFPPICNIIDDTKLPLIGVVPFLGELCVKQTLAESLNDKTAYNAFLNIAGRILGEERRILDFLPSKNRRIILNNGCSGGNRI